MTGGSRPGSGSRERGTVLAILGIVLVALSMRSAAGVIGPVFPALADDLGIDLVVLSVLGAAPPFGFALAGLLVPPATRRLGLEGSLIAAVGFIGVGQVVRALSEEPVLLVASTFLVMVGIGAGNVLLPPLVRRYAPHRIGLLTAIYLVLMSVSASTPAFVGVQLADATGWRFAVGIWAVLPALAIVPWIATTVYRRASPGELTPPDVDEVAGVVHEPGPVTRAVARPRLISASPTAWAIMATLTLSSITIYVVMAFLPSMLVAAGSTPEAGGAALGVALVLGIPQALLVPLIASRRGATIPMIAVAGVCAVVGWGGMLLAPGFAPVLWAVLLGSVSIVFPLSLLLVNTRTRDHRITVSVSAFAQGLAYLVAGVFSLVLGAVHDATGSWSVVFVVLAATAALTVPAMLILRHGRYVDDELLGHR